MRRALLVAALLALAGPACVDDDIPPRPSVDGLVSDAGAGADADADLGDAPFAGDGASSGTPVLLATGSPCLAMDLAIANGTLYWTEDATGLVRSVSAAGGPVSTIASGQMRAGAIAVDAKNIFWVAGDRKTIMRRAVAGGAISTFVAATTETERLGGENDINALLVSNNTLYFGRYTFAYKMPTDGSMFTAIMSSPPEDLGKPGAFALDGTHLYQTEIGHNAVSRELLNGMQNGKLETGAMAPLAPDRIAVSVADLLIDAIAVRDDYVIWANGASIWTKLSNHGEDDPASILATAVGTNPISGFVVSGAFIYFGESSANAVEVVPIDSGLSRVLATGQMNPGQFVADDANVYWRTSDCRVMKLAK